MDPKFDTKRYIYPFVLFLNLNLIQNGKIPFHIDIIYRINYLCCITFEFDKGNPLYQLNGSIKMSVFWSIIHRFQFGSIYPQELGGEGQLFEVGFSKNSLLTISNFNKLMLTLVSWRYPVI